MWRLLFQHDFAFVLSAKSPCVHLVEEHTWLISALEWTVQVYAHGNACVCFCLCLVCIFFQCTYFQNIFPPGSLQAVETLLEISPVSFIMLLLPLAFYFSFAEGVIWAFLTFVAGYYFRHCIKVHLICRPNFPRSRRSIIGEMFQKSSKHERGNEPRRMCPKTHRGRWKQTRQRQKLGRKDDGEQRERQRGREEKAGELWACWPSPLAVRIK